MTFGDGEAWLVWFRVRNTEVSHEQRHSRRNFTSSSSNGSASSEPLRSGWPQWSPQHASMTTRSATGLLMWSQAEQRGATVTRPAGYRTWQKLGRQVRRGERGYRILAPMTRRLPGEDAETEEPKRIVTGFRVVSVFDVSQTDRGTSGGHRSESADRSRRCGLLAQAAVGLIEEQGYEVLAGISSTGPTALTRPTTKEVVVEENLDEAQRTKTTVHELAHVLMHSSESEITCRGRIEVEAESVAYVVCGIAGLDTSAYSVAYIAQWAETTTEPERTLLATAERIVSNARRILEHIDRSKAFAADQT